VEDWTGLFGSYLKSGVYAVSQGASADIQSAAKAGGLEFMRVDLKGVTGKAGFLKKAAAGLAFPAYFGMNWDAFGDCLTDLAWRPATGYVILLNNYQSFAAKAPADAHVARRIFDSSVQYWKQREVPFYIILR
jgi:hypothetical protein